MSSHFKPSGAGYTSGDKEDEESSEEGGEEADGGGRSCVVEGAVRTLEGGTHLADMEVEEVIRRV